jgi:hypothetical protein
MVMTYKALFANQHHIDRCLGNSFVPVLETILSFSAASSVGILVDAAAEAGADHLIESNRDGLLTRAIQRLIFATTEKESLVHGDLTSTNIIVDADSDSISVKVLDFSGFSYGPTGFDLGAYLSHLVWYYTAHSSPLVRRKLLGSVRATLEAYKSAFFVQAASAIVENPSLQGINIDEIFRKVLIDATGFLGIQGLSLLLTSKSNQLPLMDLKEMNWGDHRGWNTSVHRRQMMAYTKALEHYAKHDSYKDTISDWSSLIVSILLLDDAALITEHKTEYWDP